MKSILATLGLTPIDLNDGQTFAHHSVTLSKDGVPGDPVETTDAEITFDGLEPGTYVATGFSVDSAGVAWPSVTSDPIVVPATAQADVLSSITLKLA